MINLLKELLGEAISLEQLDKIAEELETNYISKDKTIELETAYAEKLNNLKLSYTLENALKEAGAKNIKAVEALLDKEQIVFSETGEIAGLYEQIESLKKSDSFLFETVQIKGLKPAEKSEYTGKSPTKMTYSELCKYLKSNPTTKL